MRKDFQGNRLVEIDLAGFVDDAHATAAQFLQQFVITQATRLDRSAENALDQVGALGESAAILIQLEESTAPLTEVEFDFQQFCQEGGHARWGAIEGESLQSGEACLPGMPSRTGRTPGQCGRSTRHVVA